MDAPIWIDYDEDADDFYYTCHWCNDESRRYVLERDVSQAAVEHANWHAEVAA
jgi:hypothetical protein